MNGSKCPRCIASFEGPIRVLLSNTKQKIARTSASIEEEWFSFLVSVKDEIEVSMGEEYASGQEVMSFFSCQFFNSTCVVEGQDE
mgnify:CR=1 FL=1